MSEAKNQPEPSVEEILASIREIIAEESDAPAAGGVKATGTLHDDILELTEMLADDGSVVRLTGLTAPSAAAPDTTPAAPKPPVEGGEVERLLSAAGTAASVEALARLLRERTAGEAGAAAPAATASESLEPLVRDTLRPLLSRWLEEHLPALVERLVREEIDRLARDAQRR